MKTELPFSANLSLANLRGEREAPWTLNTFIEPREFEIMAQTRSCVIFGEAGSGKTTLYNATKQRGQSKEAPILVVDWKPISPDQAHSASALIQYHFNQLFSLLVFEFIKHLAVNTQTISAYPLWAQDLIRWLAENYYQGDLHALIDHLVESKYDKGILESFISQKPRAIFASPPPISNLIRYISELIRHLGLNGIWIMVDGLEPWLDVTPDLVTTSLTTIMSTLALFDEPRFAFKIFLPSILRPVLFSTSGVFRRRMDVFELKWNSSELCKITERRLSVYLGNEVFSLNRLCQSKNYLEEMLIRYGGLTPRGWLNFIKPYVEGYKTNNGKALSIEQVKRIWLRNIPALRFDPETNRFYRGGGEVEIPYGNTYRLLYYLITHPQRRCSREELYYIVHWGLEAIPSPSESNWQHPKEWRGMVDTSIWRARNVIEPDPRNPVYIITGKDASIHLENSEFSSTTFPARKITARKTLTAFLCHSSGDKDYIRELYKRLVLEGVNPWLDEENILPGEVWDDVIRDAVRKSQAIIVCLSDSSINKRGYVQKEIKYALDVADEQLEDDIFVIPARLGPVTVPGRLSRWQWVNLYEDNGFDKLMMSLKECARKHDIEL